MSDIQEFEEEAQEVKEISNIYWLFTSNYLRHTKAYYDTKEEALLKLKHIIKTSEKPYAKFLMIQAKNEDTDNQLALKEWNSFTEKEQKELREKKLHYKEKVSANKLYKRWRYFSKHELKASIQLIEIDKYALSEEERENIFKKRVN